MHDLPEAKPYIAGENVSRQVEYAEYDEHDAENDRHPRMTRVFLTVRHQCLLGPGIDIVYANAERRIDNRALQRTWNGKKEHHRQAHHHDNQRNGKIECVVVKRHPHQKQARNHKQHGPQLDRKSVV